MLETIISSTTGESFTLLNTLAIIMSAIMLGLVISVAYIKTNKKNGYSSNFPITFNNAACNNSNYYFTSW